MKPERWKAIPGYEGIYEVSNHGRVRSLDRLMPHPRGRDGFAFYRGKILELKPADSDGYVHVGLRAGGSRSRVWRVHQLVMLAFKGPPPEGKLVCHKDDVRHHNHLSNLRYSTQVVNMSDAIRNEVMPRGVRNGHALLTDKDVRKIRRLFAKGLNNSEIADMFGVHRSTIRPIRLGLTWTHV